MTTTGDPQTHWRLRHVLNSCKRRCIRLRSSLTSERGQTLLEFAFVMPILLVFLLSLVDFGIALDRREVIQHAVREGARSAAVGLSEDQITGVVVTQSGGVLEAADVAVCYTTGPVGDPVGSEGSAVRVSATFTYAFSLGSGELLNAFGVDPDALSIVMTPRAESRLEKSVSGVTPC